MSSLNILETHYKQTGKSRKTNEYGMNEMQARAFKEREAQYLLIKSPPASGKSRAMMFLALDKLRNQDVKKVIIAVPQIVIGNSFQNTNLQEFGFPSNWHIEPKDNLCIEANKKAGLLVGFIDDPDSEIALCTHDTLKAAFNQLKPSDFNNILLGIDEFHHVSVSEGNILGGLIDDIIEGSSAHIVAMTGSYFRGDALPIMTADYESLFTQVSYSYYEQLNGYEYLKSLGINYHFYKNDYLSTLHEVLDNTKKTLIHIPNVNSSASTKRKLDEVDAILDKIGDVESTDKNGIISVRTVDGRLLKIADLVTDIKSRTPIQNYLANITNADDVDIIIALGMAKEGFDWVWCEHVLTVGYRSSHTEVVQIIGRATRDCEGKTHAQFTNLIAYPNALDGDTSNSVNNLLKAITLSLLMEQVLTPNVNFKPRSRATSADLLDQHNIFIDDSSNPMSDSAFQALNNIDNLTTSLMQEQNFKKSVAPMMMGQQDVKTFIEFELQNLIKKNHPDVPDDELLDLAYALHASLTLKTNGGIVEECDLPDNAPMMALDADGNPNPYAPSTLHQPKPSFEFLQPSPESKDRQDKDGAATSRNFALIAGKFINVEKLGFSLIEDIIENTNPFSASYSVLSRSIDADALKFVESQVSQSRSNMSDQEAVDLYGFIVRFKEDHGREPSPNKLNPYEDRLAQALTSLKEQYRKRKTHSLTNDIKGLS